jgi:hypothetical protein
MNVNKKNKHARLLGAGKSCCLIFVKVVDEIVPLLFIIRISTNGHIQMREIQLSYILLQDQIYENLQITMEIAKIVHQKHLQLKEFTLFQNTVQRKKIGFKDN